MRDGLLLELNAAGGRLGDLWKRGADAEFMKADTAAGHPRDVTGSGRRLELARQMFLAGYNAAEFSEAVRSWEFAEGKLPIKDRDIVRDWVAVRPVLPTGAAFGVVHDDGDESWIARYQREHPKVILGNEVKIVFSITPDTPGNFHLVTPPKFPAFRPDDWAMVTQANGHKRRVHLSSVYIAKDTGLLDGLRFLPGVAQENCQSFNTWRGWGVQPTEAGSCEGFKRHLRERVCGGDSAAFAYLWQWMGHIVQRPREKPGVAVVLIGGKGSGKSIVGRVLGKLIGSAHHAVVKDREHVLGRFNGHLADALLVQIEEAVWARDPKGEGVLKSLITEGNMTVERKGIDAVAAESFCRVVITSNETFVVPATHDERRFLVLKLSNEKLPPAVAADIMDPLEAGGYGRLMHELLSTDLTGFDRFTPPRTAALAEQVAHNLPPVEAWWTEEWEDGHLWGAYASVNDDGDAGKGSAGAEGVPGVTVPGVVLRDRFGKWAQGQRIGRPSDAAWGADLTRLGLVRYRTAGGNRWRLPPRKAPGGTLGG